MKAAIEAMPVSSERSRLHASRCRWLFSLLYIGGLRVSEICDASMSGFFSRRKGSKTRLVPATGELMAELMRYRKAHALSPLPLEGEGTPQVMTLIAPIKPMARSATYELFKGVMQIAAVARCGNVALTSRLRPPTSSRRRRIGYVTRPEAT